MSVVPSAKGTSTASPEGSQIAWRLRRWLAAGRTDSTLALYGGLVTRPNLRDDWRQRLAEGYALACCAVLVIYLISSFVSWSSPAATNSRPSNGPVDDGADALGPIVERGPFSIVKARPPVENSSPRSLQARISKAVLFFVSFVGATRR